MDTKMEFDEIPQKRKLKYPIAVFFIIGNEFCERFSFYGMRTTLSLYFKEILGYSENTSTVMYHTFIMLAYFFPLFGAIIADAWLGKYKTIMYISIIYSVGQLLLSASAAGPFGIPPREFSILGLLLIAFGTGGIKPCVSAFGGDQFTLPDQEKQLIAFFSLFYLSINAGSLISTFLTPILRKEVTCFGLTSCYSLAFLVPAILMIVATIIFFLGRFFYKMQNPQGNVVVKVTKCVSHAIKTKINSGSQTRSHWLEYADNKYDSKLITDIKATFQVLKLFIPLPIFWALFDQQGSRWTFQAMRMDGELGSYLLKPDQTQFINPLLIILFIPLCQTVIYPVLEKFCRINTPLRRLTLGGVLAALSFVVSGLVEWKLETTYAKVPESGLAQLRIFNTLDCDVPMYVGNQSFDLKSLSMWQNIELEAHGKIELPYKVDFSNCSGLPAEINGKITGQEEIATSWVLTNTGLSYSYLDFVDKSTSGDPSVRALISRRKDDNSATNITLRLKSKTEKDEYIQLNHGLKETNLQDVEHGTYDLFINGKRLKTDIPLKLGGVYTIVGDATDKDKPRGDVVTVTEANSMHMLWLIPQYVVITLGEVMFSVTGLEFAFTQAPSSMKSLLQAAWLLTVAMGNLIVVIIAEAQFFKRQIFEFFLFAALMFADMLIFALMAKRYKYVEYDE